MGAIWNIARVEDQTYPQLQKQLDADTVIIGAGITGLSVALRLAQAGQRVVVVDSLQVGTGSTGQSTGNLYATVSTGLRHLRTKWNDDVLREVVALRALAVDFVEETVAGFTDRCDFVRCPLYYRAADKDELEAEWQAAQAAGLQAELQDGIPGWPTPTGRLLRIHDQAQFNPQAYAQGLANAVTELGGLVFESSRVCFLDASEGVVVTENGQVRADSIVQATHTPKGINMLQAEMSPYREYGVAAELDAADTVPEGIVWLADRGLSLRRYDRGGRSYLIAIGEKHKTGEDSPGVNHYHNLRQHLFDHYPVVGNGYSWSTQQFRAADLLPYIGRSGHGNVYVATGFAADGLTWGTVASAIIGNQILGRESRGGKLFNPRRFTPAKSASEWAKQNALVGRHLAEKLLPRQAVEELAQVAPGEGRIVRYHGEDLAVHKSTSNKVSVVSATCPHMKCRVQWNASDTTWDCPCHGSRFATDGTVLEGPAYEPLARRSP